MYETWLGSSKTLAKIVTRAWKLSRYRELNVSPGTIYLLEQGFNAYSRINTMQGSVAPIPNVNGKRH